MTPGLVQGHTQAQVRMLIVSHPAQPMHIHTQVDVWSLICTRGQRCHFLWCFPLGRQMCTCSLDLIFRSCWARSVPPPLLLVLALLQVVVALQVQVAPVAPVMQAPPNRCRRAPALEPHHRKVWGAMKHGPRGEEPDKAETEEEEDSPAALAASPPSSTPCSS